MNHKQHHDIVRQCIDECPEYEEVVGKLVLRLLEGLYIPDDSELMFKADNERLKQFDISKHGDGT
jgi:hypothetical protein